MGPFDATWLTTAIQLATPLLFAATGELVAERAGVINIGLEGMMLSGAFFSFLGLWLFHAFWLAVLIGVLAGVVLAAIMALLSIQARADQIVTGVGINILALGVTTFAFRQIFADRGQVLLARPSRLAVPLLSKLPFVGGAFFRQTLLVYVAFLLVPVTWFVLYRTSWGLAIRAAGEVPGAADTAGVSVAKVRWIGTLVAGGMAGVAGAFLSIGQLGLFVEGMSAGRGFIALAAVIFGGWEPAGVMGAALVFGAADSLQLRIQAESRVPHQVWLMVAVVAVVYVLWRVHLQGARRTAVGIAVGAAIAVAGAALFAVDPHFAAPAQLWLAVPYVLALLALAGLVGRVRMPSALAQPYLRGGAEA